jgi:HK97 family phage prohead protease
VIKELRTVAAVELRASGSEKEMRVSGYAATFNNPTTIGSFREVIAPGAFTRTLADNDDVVLLVNHDANLILARRSAGTLELTQDSKGLKFSAVLPATSIARDCYENLRTGLLKECSFGFFVENEGDEDWTRSADGTPLRTLKSVRLFDCSVVCFPAYSGTQAQARNVISPEAEKRMSAFGQEAETAKRRARAVEALSEIEAEQTQDELLKARAYLAL